MSNRKVCEFSKFPSLKYVPHNFTKTIFERKNRKVQSRIILHQLTSVSNLDVKRVRYRFLPRELFTRLHGDKTRRAPLYSL